MKLEKSSKNKETWKWGGGNGKSYRNPAIMVGHRAVGTALRLQCGKRVCVCVCWGPSMAWRRCPSVREGCICGGSGGSSGGGGGVATHTAVRSRSNACNCVEIDG
jgi:hypothetical protein